jgi:hypothetical protein
MIWHNAHKPSRGTRFIGWSMKGITKMDIKKGDWVRHSTSTQHGLGPFRVADVRDGEVLIDCGDGRGKWMDAAAWMVVRREVSTNV